MKRPASSRDGPVNGAGAEKGRVGGNRGLDQLLEEASARGTAARPQRLAALLELSRRAGELRRGADALRTADVLLAQLRDATADAHVQSAALAALEPMACSAPLAAALAAEARSAGGTQEGVAELIAREAHRPSLPPPPTCRGSRPPLPPTPALLTKQLLTTTTTPPPHQVCDAAGASDTPPRVLDRALLLLLRAGAARPALPRPGLPALLAAALRAGGARARALALSAAAQARPRPRPRTKPHEAMPRAAHDAAHVAPGRRLSGGRWWQGRVAVAGVEPRVLCETFLADPDRTVPPPSY